MIFIVVRSFLSNVTICCNFNHSIFNVLNVVK
nr:MAG TPA: hypothetical protein [Caudoviricetes sp.]